MNCKGLFLTALATFPMIISAQTSERRATLIDTTTPDEGRCTISVVLNGAADVEIRGEYATLRNVTGRAPYWQRFECTGPLPYSPASLKIRAIQGNGRVTLMQDSSTGGVALVQVSNFEGGDQAYTFDVYWTPTRSYTSTEADRSEADRSAIQQDDVLQSCRSAVENNLRDDGYRHVRFDAISLDNRDAQDWVTGTATAYRSDGSGDFRFSCRVDPSDGQVRRLDVTHR